MEEEDHYLSKKSQMFSQFQENSCESTLSTPGPVKRILSGQQKEEIFESNSSTLSPFSPVSVGKYSGLEQKLNMLKKENILLKADLSAEQEAKFKLESLHEENQTQLIMLRETVRKYKDELMSLRAECDKKSSLEEDLELYLQKNRDLHERIEVMSHKLDNVNLNLKIASNDKEELQEEVRALKGELKKSNCELDILKNSLQENQLFFSQQSEELMSLSEKLQSTCEENHRLKDEVDVLQETCRKRTCTKQHLESTPLTPTSQIIGESMSVITEFKVRELKDEIVNLQSTWMSPRSSHDLRAKCSLLNKEVKVKEQLAQSELSKIQMELEGFNSKLDIVEKTVSSLRDENFHLRTMRDSIQEELKTVSASFEASISEITATAAERKLQIEHKDIKIATLKNQIEELKKLWTSKEQSLNKSLTDEKERCVKLQAEQEALSKKALELDDEKLTLQTQISLHVSKNQQLIEDLVAKDEEISSMKEEQKQLSEVHQTTISNITATAEKRKLEIEKLSLKIKVLFKEREELEKGWTSKVTSLTKDLASEKEIYVKLQAEKKALSKKTHELNDEKLSLQTQLSQHFSENQKLTQDVKAKNEEINAMKEEQNKLCVDHQVTINNITATMEKRKLKIEELNAKIQVFSEENKHLESSCTFKVKSLLEDLAAEKARYEKLQSEQTALIEEARELDNEKLSLQQQLTRVLSENQQLGQDVKSKEEELISIEEEQTKLSKDHQATTNNFTAAMKKRKLEIEEIKTKLQVSSDESKQLKSNCTSKVNTLTEELTAEKEKYAKLQAEQETLSKKSQELNDEKLSLQTQLNQQVSENQQMIKDVKAKEEEIISVQEILKKLTEAHQADVSNKTTKTEIKQLEIDELNAKIQIISKDREELSRSWASKVKSLTEDLTVEKEKYSKLQAEQAALSKESNELNNEKRAFQTQFSVHVSENQQLSKDLKAKEDEINSMKERLKKLSEDHQATINNITATAEKRKFLIEEQDLKIQAVSKESAELEKSFNSKVKSLSEDLASEKEKYAKVQAELEVSFREAQELNDEKLSLQAQLNQHVSEIHQTTKVLKTREEEINSLKEEQENLTADHQATINSAKTNAETKHLESEELILRVKALSKDREDLESASTSKIQSLTEHLAAEKEKYAKLRVEQEVLSKKAQELNKEKLALQTQVSQHVSKNQLLTQDVKAKEEEISELKKLSDESQVASKTLAAAVEEREQQIKEQNLKIQVLSDHKQELENNLALKEKSLSDELVIQKEKYTTLKVEQKSLIGRVEELNNEKISWKAQEEQYLSQNSKLNAVLTARKQEISSMFKDQRKLSSNFQTTVDSLTTLSEEKEAKIEELKLKVGDLLSEKEELIRDWSFKAKNLTDDLTHETERHEILKTQHKALSKGAQVQNSEKLSLQRQLRQTLIENDELCQVLKSRQEEIKSLTAQVLELEAELKSRTWINDSDSTPKFGSPLMRSKSQEIFRSPAMYNDNSLNDSLDCYRKAPRLESSKFSNTTTDASPFGSCVSIESSMLGLKDDNTHFFSTGDLTQDPDRIFGKTDLENRDKLRRATTGPGDLRPQPTFSGRPSLFAFQTVLEEPDNPNYDRTSSLHRVAELQDRNKKQLAHLKSSYPIETQGQTPSKCDETIRVGDPKKTLRRLISESDDSLQDTKHDIIKPGGPKRDIIRGLPGYRSSSILTGHLSPQGTKRGPPSSGQDYFPANKTRRKTLAGFSNTQKCGGQPLPPAEKENTVQKSTKFEITFTPTVISRKKAKTKEAAQSSGVTTRSRTNKQLTKPGNTGGDSARKASGLMNRMRKPLGKLNLKK